MKEGERWKVECEIKRENEIRDVREECDAKEGGRTHSE